MTDSGNETLHHARRDLKKSGKSIKRVLYCRKVELVKRDCEAENEVIGSASGGLRAVVCG